MKTSYVNKFGFFFIALLTIISTASLRAANIPNAHERAINELMKGYQKELNLLIPILVKDPTHKKATDFVSVFFTSDTISVINHVVPGNIKADKKVEVLADKNLLKAPELLTLLAGIYKQGFKYELSRDDMVIESLDSTAVEDRLVHRYKVSIPVSIEGKPNNQLIAEVKDTLSFITLVYSDTKRNVRFAKIQTINRKGGNQVTTPSPILEPKKEVTVVKTNAEEAIIDWSAERKVSTLIEFTKVLKDSTLKDSTFNRIEDSSRILFDPSGFVKVITKDGKVIELTKFAFFARVRTLKTSYQFQSSIISYYDMFRRNEYDKWFCRITTYHGVSQFDKGNPLATKTTTVLRMPTKSKSASSKDGYAQISEITFKEL